MDKCKNVIGINELKKLHEQIIASRDKFVEDLFLAEGIDKSRLIFVRNINKKANLNQVKPIFSFEMDTKDEEENLKK